jgi:hypothetical protein
VSAVALADLRARGVVLEGGDRLRVQCPAKVVDELRPVLKAHRNELLGALQDEAEDDIVRWPQAHRRWLVQTVGFALSEGFSRRAAFWMAFRAVRAALDADRARIIAEAAEDGMLRAALDSGFVTVGQVAADDAADSAADEATRGAAAAVDPRGRLQ